MKILLLILMLLTSNAYADSKVTALTEDTTPSGTDITYSVKNPSGSPLSRKVQYKNIFQSVGNLSVDGTNIGIGTINPGTHIFSLNGNMEIIDSSSSGSVENAIFMRNLGNPTNAAVLQMYNSSDVRSPGPAVSFSAFNAGGTPIYMEDGNVKDVGLMNAANVGIGTILPNGRLQINSGTSQVSVSSGGNVGIGTTGAPFIKMYVNNSSGNAFSFLRGGVVGTSGSADMRLYNDISDYIIFRVSGTGSGGTFGPGLAELLSANTTGDFYVGTQGATDSLKLVSNTAVRMTIHNNGNVGIGTITPQAGLAVINGNVGIGTWTAATARLETDGFRLSTNSAAGRVLVSGSTGIGTWMAASTLPIAGGGSGTVNSGTINQAAYYAASGTAVSGASGVSIDGVNVGIGSSAPNIKLLVTQQSATQIPVSGSTAQFVGTDANPLRITFDTHNNSSSSGTAFMFRRSRGTSASPSALLADDVIGALSGRGYGATGYGAASTGLINIKANQSFTDTNMGTYISFDTTPDNSVTAAEMVRITGAGNIGIGTIFPASKLTIGGGGVGIGTNSNSAFIQTTAGIGNLIVEKNVGIGTTSTQIRLAVVGGNVGIGTWTASAALDTNGFRLSGNGVAAGNVLVSTSIGIGTWMAASTLPITGGGGGSSDYLSILTNTEVAVTTTATATISKQHLISGTSANYTVTLPAASGNIGKFIGFRIDNSATKLFTIKGNSSELIDGVNTHIMWAGESATLYCDGTGWQKIAGKTIPMSVVLSRTGASQTIAQSTWVAAIMDTKVAGTSLMFDSVNGRVTIVRPGNYLAVAALYCDANLFGYLNIGLNTPSNTQVIGGGASINTSVVAGSVTTVYSVVAGDWIVSSAYLNNTGNLGTVAIDTAAPPTTVVTEIPTW